MTPQPHTCHWPNCREEVPSRFFCCLAHWQLLPQAMRAELWRTYRPGQESDKDPSREYVAAARVALDWAQDYEAKTRGRLLIRAISSIAAALAVVALSASPARAVACSGTILPAGNGTVVSAPFLLSTGNCVAAGDKIFGEFSASGAITGDGSASFTFTMSPGNVTLGFSGVVGPSATGTINYAVAVDPALSQGFLIDDLQKDFTFNSIIGALPASVSLTGVVNPGAILFDCFRTVNPSGGTCPVTHTFGPVMQIGVSETIVTSANAIVTSLTDTISQVPPSVPEPSTLALLASGLLVLGFIGRWRRQG